MYSFNTEQDFKEEAYKYTSNHFNEFIELYPHLIADHFNELQYKEEELNIKEEELNNVIDDNNKLHQNELKKLHTSYEKEKVTLLKKQEDALKRDLNKELDYHQNLLKRQEEYLKKNMEEELNHQRCLIENQYKDQLLEQKKILQEFKNANDNKQSTHSMYKGLTFEKYIEAGLQEHFNNLYNINGDASNFCMDIRMINKHSSNTIGIECKSKDKIISSDIKKFIKDKADNKFFASVFISESAPIPKKTNKLHQWFIHNNELWIQSNDINIITSTINSFVTLLNNTNNSSSTSINEQNDFIISMYNTFHEQKQAIVKQEKSFYKYIKSNFPEKLNSHLYIVPVSKLTKKYKTNPY